MAIYQRPQWTPPSYLRRQTAPQGEPPTYAADDPIFAGSQPAELYTLPPKPSLNDLVIRRYSSIIPAEVVKHKLTPKPLASMPDVEYMDWHFDEPTNDDDNEVRLYVGLSREDIAIIKRWGYQYDVFETMPLFEPADITALQELQNEEYSRAVASEADYSTLAGLYMEHRQQLEWAEQQQIEITILDYLALPYRKQFENRFQATLAQRKITSKLAEFKKKIDHHRAQ